MTEQLFEKRAKILKILAQTTETVGKRAEHPRDRQDGRPEERSRTCWKREGSIVATRLRGS